MKAKPKCLNCKTASAASDTAAFCSACSALGEDKIAEVRQNFVAQAQALRGQLVDMRDRCQQRCVIPSGEFPDLPVDAPPSTANGAGEGGARREVCDNMNCQVIFRRVRCAKELRAASDALVRLGVTDW